ncbi:hypothetical protein CPB83DRAFT_906496 [Crepidotus variabilis]|uniref:Uncharacterized protein n=1 Tax=Crepidotus variabilis TaxID=179855 RepID=A0A9P6EHM3_9AGAR|nr:hypothetical protein CPB83DRAFT_906496 [Crepidotus variabilis]
MLETMTSEPNQERRISEPCWYWLGIEGSCPNGELCKFRHEDQQCDQAAPISIQAPTDTEGLKGIHRPLTGKVHVSIKERPTHNLQFSESNLGAKPEIQNVIKSSTLGHSCRFCSSTTCIGGIECLLTNGKTVYTPAVKAVSHDKSNSQAKPEVQHLGKTSEPTQSCRFCSSITCSGGIKCLLTNGQAVDALAKAVPDENVRPSVRSDTGTKDSTRKRIAKEDSPTQPVQRLSEEHQRRIVEKRKKEEEEKQRHKEEQQKRILEERKNKEVENRRLRELFEEEKKKKVDEKRQQEQEELSRREQERKRREDEKRTKERERQKREEEWRRKEEERQAEARKKKEALVKEHERAVQAAKEAKVREEAEATQQFAVGESSLITCAAGLDIRYLIAGFELCRVKIKNIPLNTKENDLSELFIQHGQIAGEFLVSEIKRPRLTNKLEAIALVKGEATAHVLHGIKFQGEILTVELCKAASGPASKNTPFLTVSWAGARVKTEMLVATYPSRVDAETWAVRIDGIVWNGFKLRTALNGSKRSFDVTISNCPPGSALNPLSQELAGTPNVRPLNPTLKSLEATVLGVVRDHILLQAGAKEDTYRVILSDVDNGDTKAMVDFDTWDNLKLAYVAIHEQRLDCKDGNLSPVLHAWQSEPHHYSCLIPHRQYIAQQKQWNALSEKVPGREAWVHVQAGDKPDRMLVRILGEDEKAAGALKVRAEGLVAGETLDATQWHSSFLTLTGRKFFDKVYNEAKVHIRSDFESRTLKVFGEPEAIPAARTLIQEEVEHKTAEEMVYTLDRQAVGFFVRVGVGRLKELIGDDNVDLQVTCRPARILIKGGAAARHHLQRLLEESRAISDISVGGEGDLCPVCYTEPTSPEQLGCGHTFCAGCLQHFLNSAGETKTFPLLCTGSEAKCGTPISLPFMRRFMSAHAFEHLVDVAFTCYLERHPQELKYCTTPDCKQVYRRQQPPQNIHCPSCFKTICSACDDEVHEKMSCEESRLYRNPEERDRRNEEFMVQNGYKKCPRCSSWIEKIDGCNRMSCRCGAHLCWRCTPATAFNTAAEAYAHLNSTHGGYY